MAARARGLPPTRAVAPEGLSRAIVPAAGLFRLPRPPGRGGRSRIPSYIRLSRSRSSQATRSSIWWMVALTGPSSITSAPVGAMNRPSEVPAGRRELRIDAGHLPDRRGHRVQEPAPAGQKRCRGVLPVDLPAQPVPVQYGLHALHDLRVGEGGRVAQVEEGFQRARDSRLPPRCRPRTFDTWKRVGGKSALPSSQALAASSARAAHAPWMGFTARSGYAMLSLHPRAR